VTSGAGPQVEVRSRCAEKADSRRRAVQRQFRVMKGTQTRKLGPIVIAAAACVAAGHHLSGAQSTAATTHVLEIRTYTL
jgi:hypothetical protein